MVPGELAPKLETSFQGTGTLFGVETNDLGTYTRMVSSETTPSWQT